MCTPIRSYFENLSIEEFRQKHSGLWMRQIYQEIIKSGLVTAVTSRKEKHILDIGCGDLALANFLIEHDLLNSKYIAIDFNSHLLYKVENESPAIIRKRQLKLIASDFLEYPFEKEQFDLVFLINIIPYMSNENLNKALIKIHNLMSQQAVLVLTDIEDVPFWEKKFHGIEIIYHENIDALLAAHKFDVIEKRSIYFFPIENVTEIKMEIANLYMATKCQS